LQHLGFVAMNPERHATSHWDFYQDLLQGDLEDAQSHRKFYDEYNAVLDMPAKYYLDTISVVFQKFLLPQGLWDVSGERVNPSKIKDCALLTIEGELDDISGKGQTHAAHKLCTGIAPADQQELTVEGAGHYGIFSGRRWRTQVYPRVRAFIAAHAGAAPVAKATAAASTSKPAQARKRSVAKAPAKKSVKPVQTAPRAVPKRSAKPVNPAARPVAKRIATPAKKTTRVEAKRTAKPPEVATRAATKNPARPAKTAASKQIAKKAAPKKAPTRKNAR
ncbi:MAG: hypothetical protein M3Q51_05735, partial [Pseudomonadota bacterium]|nr:hypothetical protein [Pseudomonadota bacterium]